MCNCITDIEGKLSAKMAEQYPGWEVVEEVTFQNTSYLLGVGKTVLGNPVLGRVRKGKVIRKFDTSMLPTYCPFCGAKI